MLEAEESTVGLVLAALSLLVLPALAVAKRRTGARLGSRTPRADAAETMPVHLAVGDPAGGLVLNSTVAGWWADPLAAIGIAYLAAKEGQDAWRGERCDDDCDD